jgi:hypothetical protein
MPASRVDAIRNRYKSDTVSLKLLKQESDPKIVATHSVQIFYNQAGHLSGFDQFNDALPAGTVPSRPAVAVVAYAFVWHKPVFLGVFFEHTPLVYDGIALALVRRVVPREPLIQDCDFVHYPALLSSDRPVRNDFWACPDWKSSPSFFASRRILSANVSLVLVLKYALAVYTVEPIRFRNLSGSRSSETAVEAGLVTAVVFSID